MRHPIGKPGSQLDPLWYIAQGYGNPTSYGFHEGNDYNLRSGGDSDLGQNLYAIANGTVTSIHHHITQNTFGEHVHIQHDGEWGTVYSHYAHCQSIIVAVGDVVKEGQVIGKLGKSGTDVAHLHFAIKNQPTGVDAVAHTKADLLKWEDPTKFIEKWSNTMPDDALKACLEQHTKLVDEATSLKKQIESLKSESEAFKVDVDNMKKGYEEDIAKLKVELQGKLKLETEIQQEKDGRREDNLAWEMKRVEWEGAMEKIRQQMASDDLSLREYKVLIKALMKKILRDIESLKK